MTKRDEARQRREVAARVRAQLDEQRAREERELAQRDAAATYDATVPERERSSCVQPDQLRAWLAEMTGGPRG